MTQATHVFDQQLGGSTPELRITLRPLTEDDHRYALLTFREGYKESSTSYLRAPWPMYKETIGKQLEQALASASLLGAYVDDGRIAGWMAYSPGRSVDTVHWLYTRYRLGGVPCRRRGVMSALVDAASLGSRVCYTHRGPREVLHRARRQRSPDAARSAARGPTSDLAIAEWLRSRGTSVVFVPYEEWNR